MAPKVTKTPRTPRAPRVSKATRATRTPSPGSPESQHRIGKSLQTEASRERRRRYAEGLADRIHGMDREKKSFPASSKWHDDETALFEALYLRQYRPLVPAAWDVQLRGVPVPDHIFSRNLFDLGHFGAPPIYPAQPGNDCEASRAFMDIANLSTHVRGLRQLGHFSKIALYIRDEIARYIQWSIHDAHLSGIAAVPNIFCEVVDTSIYRSTGAIADRVAECMQKQAQQSYNFWSGLRVRFEKDGVYETVDAPVITGLFILNQTVMVCTIDSAKGQLGDISYHVAIDFAKQSQNFWNALSLGIVVCMARDAMVSRDGFLKPDPSIQ